MNINQSARELEFRTGIKKFMWVLLAVSLATNLLLAIMGITSKSTHRETLVPPEINKSFWVDGEKVSSEYLEQMGKFLLDLALNNTPVNCDTNRTALLKYVGSGSYAEINSQQSANCKIIQSSLISMFFAASTVTIRESTREIVFAGGMIRWLNDRRLPDRQVAYRVRLGYSGGRIYLAQLVEVDPRNADPFSEAAVQKDVVEQMQSEMAINAASRVANAVANKASEPASEPKGVTQ